MNVIKKSTETLAKGCKEKCSIRSCHKSNSGKRLNCLSTENMTKINHLKTILRNKNYINDKMRVLAFHYQPEVGSQDKVYLY
jgi:hypothetical protein